jgi:hypothetical protein
MSIHVRTLSLRHTQSASARTAKTVAAMAIPRVPEWRISSPSSRAAVKVYVLNANR